MKLKRYLNMGCLRVFKCQSAWSVLKWVKKMQYVYTTDYYPAIKESEIMPFVATRIDPEIVTLSYLRQEYPMTSLICGI